MLILSSWSERFRSDIGFNGVSQIWNDRLAWYFWLADSPGVYQLEMMDMPEDMDNGGGPYTAAFRVKCYPYPNGSAFQSFSFFERKLVQSRLFDNTNTPAFEHQGDIPDDLFTVAMVEITMDQEGHSALFSFESMACLRTCFAQETHHVFNTIDEEKTFGKEEIDRDVPGFQIGYPLFDCLMCQYANTYKQSPNYIRCWGLPGYEAIIKGGDIFARRTSDINGFKLCLFYSDRGLGSHPEDAYPMANSDEKIGDIIYERSFECGHHHEDKREETLPVRLNPQWWSLSQQQYTSELSSSCGCH